VAAYRAYRETAKDPWPLYCIGTGPLKSLLEGVDGIHDLGFVQPDDLPEKMRNATVFVLPSVHEPWGVVVQEAAASGLALLCSDACGAADHLLDPDRNGLRFSAGDVSGLTAAMMALAGKTREELCSMGRASVELSRRYTPIKWAETVIGGLKRRGIRHSPDCRAPN
jgi:glycosyltransferase involved in cell wall biosynthesis